MKTASVTRRKVVRDNKFRCVLFCHWNAMFVIRFYLPHCLWLIPLVSLPVYLQLLGTCSCLSKLLVKYVPIKVSKSNFLRLLTAIKSGTVVRIFNFICVSFVDAIFDLFVYHDAHGNGTKKTFKKTTTVPVDVGYTNVHRMSDIIVKCVHFPAKTSNHFELEFETMASVWELSIFRRKKLNETKYDKNKR